MRYGVIGTGAVGTTLGARLVHLGHEVAMGSRRAGNERAVAWVASCGERAREGTFADAAAFAERVINATGGAVSVEALDAAGARNLAGKVLIDVSNPIARDTGFPPQLSVANTDSVGEQIQRAFPEARVVKTLNTVNCEVMVNPGMIKGGHAIFIAGNDAAAKAEVIEMLTGFGWAASDVVDLGDISNARATEMYLPLWVRLYRHLETGHFNIKLVTEG